MNADILMSDGGVAAPRFPVISGDHLEDARDCPGIHSFEP